jgi:hypothetical protein
LPAHTAKPYNRIDVKPPSQDGTFAVVTADEAVNIRLCADSDCMDIGELLNGARVRVYECQNGWSRIGKSAWVNSRYLSVRCAIQ